MPLLVSSMADGVSDSALQRLATDVERAGAAMACRYACSDEYEAALIADRRATGAYRPLQRHRFAIWSVAGLAVAICILAAF